MGSRDYSSETTSHEYGCNVLLVLAFACSGSSSLCVLVFGGLLVVAQTVVTRSLKSFTTYQTHHEKHTVEVLVLLVVDIVVLVFVVVIIGGYKIRRWFFNILLSVLLTRQQKLRNDLRHCAYHGRCVLAVTALRNATGVALYCLCIHSDCRVAF